MIKVWDYLREYEAERNEILAAVDGVFRSGKLILGENVRLFEEEFAAYCGVRHGVGVDNATNGLFLALKALGIGQGDEVITVSNTAVPTVSAIVAAGAVPRFVDVSEDTLLMDVTALDAAVTKKTRCILPVHLFGQCVDMTVVRDVARAHRLHVVEDCSQSHGATQKGLRAGAMSDISVFSFYPTKPLGTYGDGGMVMTDSDEAAKKLRRLRFYGMDQVYYAEEHGYNSRLDEVHAAILRAKLRKLGSYISARREIADRYAELLGGTNLRLPVTAPGNDHVYYVYVCRHEAGRDRLVEELRARDIHLNISYPWPIHTMRGYAELGYSEGDFPVTEEAARQIFSLPMYPALSRHDQETVCQAIHELLAIHA